MKNVNFARGLLENFAGNGNQLIYSDSLGILKPSPIILPPPQCTGTPTIAWQQNPIIWTDVFSCFRRFGIGTDYPQERLDVKGSGKFSAYDNTSDYLKIGHDGEATLVLIIMVRVIY